MNKPTERQKSALHNFGYSREEIAKMSKQEAWKTLNSLIKSLKDEDLAFDHDPDQCGDNYFENHVFGGDN